MYQNKHKNKSIKTIIYCAIAILALFNIYIPKTFAAENYFTAEGGTLELDELDPDHDPIITVRIKAAREMTVHSLHGYFTPVNDEDEELKYGFGEIDVDYPGMGGISYSLYDGEFEWSAEEYMDPSVSSEGIHVQAGDSLVRINYELKPGVDVLKRNMPARVELAVIDEGSETGKHIENVTMDAYVRAGHNLSVYKHIMGNGDLDVPNIVVGGTDVTVGIVPEPGNELVYLELNGQDVTDQVKDNVYIVTPGTESLTFYANFLRVYEVLEGDGGEHILGSKDALAFKIDNDVTYFCDRGVLWIDDEPIDMSTDCMVDPENQTIILSADFLNTLDLGEHTFEAYFSEPDSGNARASFTIIEEKNVPGVPNTGFSTSEGVDAEMTNDFVVIAVIVGGVVLTGTLARKEKQE